MIKLTEKTDNIARKLQSLPFRSKSNQQKPEEDNDIGEPSVDGAVDNDDRGQKLTVTDALDQLQSKIKNF